MYKIRACSIRINYNDRGGSKYAEKTLSHYYKDGHKSHTDCPGNKPLPL